MLLELASFTMIAAALRLFHEYDAIALHATKIEQEFVGNDMAHLLAVLERGTAPVLK